MRSDEEDDSVSVSDLDTHFISQEGDDKNIWAAKAIIGERKTSYLVDWEGIDPKTNKPWKPSWQPKHDVTDDLVLAWKKKKKRELVTKEKGKKREPAAKGGEKKQRRQAQPKPRNARSKDPLQTTHGASSTPYAPGPSSRKRLRSTASGPSHTTSRFASVTDEDIPLQPSKRMKVEQTLAVELSSGKDMRRNDKRMSSTTVVAHEEEETSDQEVQSRPSKPKQPAQAGKTTKNFPQPIVLVTVPRARATVNGARTSESAPSSDDSEPTANVKVGPPRGKKNAGKEPMVSLSAGPHSLQKTGPSLPAQKSMPNLERSHSKGKTSVHRELDSETKRPHPLAEEEEESTQSQDALGRGFDVNIFDGAGDLATAEYRPSPNDSAPLSPSPSPVALPAPSTGDGPRADPSRLRRDSVKPSSPTQRKADDSIVPETTQGTHHSSQSRDLSPIHPRAQSPTPLPREGSLIARMRNRTGSLSPTKPSKPLSILDLKGKGKAPAHASRDALPMLSANGVRFLDSDTSPKPWPAKELKKIPVITPSKFKPYLPQAEPSPSVIESFSSAEKEACEPTRSRETVESWSPPRSTLVSPAIQSRGQALAEMEERRRRSERESMRRTVNLDSIVKLRIGADKPDEQAYTSINKDLSEAPDTDPDDAIVQEMEESYLDLDGGEPALTNGNLSEEREEESVDLVLSQGLGMVSEEEAPLEIGPSSQSFENSDSLKAVRSTIHSSQSSTSQSTTDRLRKAVDENARLLKMLEETRAALSSSKHESDQQRTKDTETIKRLSTELQDTRAQLRDLAADVDLARARISDLRSERAAGEMLGQSSTQPSQEPFEQERAAWTAARTQLEVELAAAKERITSVEKDVALFREQHGIVTAFADGATDELIALRESEALARSRADDGVAMVRGMFENRIRAIEQELEEQKRLNKILTEKDERTNDAVRREAAEAVQLREERNRWKERASRAEREEARLQELVESLEDGSYHGSDTEQLPPLKVAEKVEIFLHHNGSTEAELALDGIPELPDPNASQQNGTNQRTDSTSDHDEEEVFMCLIRDGSAKTACNALFGTQSHLGAHVLKEHLTT